MTTIIEKHKITKEFKEFKDKCPLCDTQLDDLESFNQHISYCSIYYINHIGLNPQQPIHDFRMLEYHAKQAILAAQPPIVYIDQETATREVDVLLPNNIKRKYGDLQTAADQKKSYNINLSGYGGEFPHLTKEQIESYIAKGSLIDLKRIEEIKKEIKENTSLKSLEIYFSRDQSQTRVYKELVEGIYDAIKQSKSIDRIAIDGPYTRKLYSDISSKRLYVSGHAQNIGDNLEPHYPICLPSMVSHVEELIICNFDYPCSSKEDISNVFKVLRASPQLKIVKLRYCSVKEYSFNEFSSFVKSLPNLEKFVYGTTEDEFIKGKVSQLIVDIVSSPTSTLKRLSLQIDSEDDIESICNAIRVNRSLTQLKILWCFDSYYWDMIYNTLTECHQETNIKSIYLEMIDLQPDEQVETAKQFQSRIKQLQQYYHVYLKL